MEQSILSEHIQNFRRSLEGDDLAKVAAKALSKASIDDICFDARSARAMTHRFSVDIPTLEACDQKATGRCWIFAGTNLLREKIAKDLNLESFALSENYLSFYDHLEKANTFLEHIIETAHRPLEDRYVARLLSAPVGDGGWWEYFAGLCRKYGVVPREAMPETHQSSATEPMNTLINMQLRKDALVIRREAAAGASAEQLRSRKEQMLNRIYRVLALCLGNPPETFDFEYVDKEKIYHADRDLTPQAFYDKYLGRDLDRIVSIMNAPTSAAPFYGTYYTQGEESIYGTYQAKRLNLPLEEFKAAVIRQLQAGEPVWFVCDSDYFGSQEEGIWDTALYDYESLLGLDLHMDKGDLLDFRQCSLNHAMLFTGVNLVDGRPDKWKVQNSWGTDKADKGYFVISDVWFDRYVFTASIDRAWLTDTQCRQFDQAPTVMSPWNVLA